MNQELGSGEILKSSYRMGQALKKRPSFTWGYEPSGHCSSTLHYFFFKMQIIFPGLEEIGILFIYLSFNQMTATLSIFSL